MTNGCEALGRLHRAVGGAEHPARVYLVAAATSIRRNSVHRMCRCVTAAAFERLGETTVWGNGER